MIAPVRRNARTNTTPVLAADPTPQEIAARCAAIRAGWAPGERSRRRVRAADLEAFWSGLKCGSDDASIPAA